MKTQFREATPKSQNRGLTIAKARQMAKVYWGDAWGDREKGAPKKAQPYEKLTAGLVVDENDKGVLVTQEINEDGSHEYSTFVPRGMIHRIERFGGNMIQKVKGGYKAFSGTKGALSKKPKTKAGAIKQHVAVQASQMRRGERKSVVPGKPTGWTPDGAGRFKKMVDDARSGRRRKKRA